MRPPRVKWYDPGAEYRRGFEDGRVGADRAHGSDHYRRGYDDGLDEYDAVLWQTSNSPSPKPPPSGAP